MFELKTNETKKPRFAYTVRNDIPRPAVKRRQKYPFPFMEVGEMFVVPNDDPASYRKSGGSCSAASSAHSYGRRHGLKFSTYRQEDDSLVVERIY